MILIKDVLHERVKHRRHVDTKSKRNKNYQFPFSTTKCKRNRIELYNKHQRI